jgi:hypothetical protein
MRNDHSSPADPDFAMLALNHYKNNDVTDA